ncbi:unnamed protein product [Pseudo-nitzschia multistriata]|uniref:Uncharacterized protein n=1 Tax=Pseudo-nitzschia multistriata TaxID=183589 RepID=A0A448ZB70_9STRA|nr:unnamed protein product [Pseudo-nitzschia multistriata]
MLSPRSTIAAALLVLLLAVDPSHGLAGVVNRFRRSAPWGRAVARQRRTSTSTTSGVGLPVRAAVAKQGLLTEPEPELSPHPPGSTPFDADAYRQQMTDLVYQRSMERIFRD